MLLPITLTIAGASAVIGLWLGLRVSLMRRSRKVSVGDGGDPVVTARMRAHANFSEYAPLFLILLALVELARGPQHWLWAVAGAFVLGRLLHPFGMDRPGASRMRIAGILLTWASLLILAAYALALPYLTGMVGAAGRVV